jgi:hypothetical protein
MAQTSSASRRQRRVEWTSQKWPRRICGNRAPRFEKTDRQAPLTGHMTASVVAMNDSHIAFFDTAKQLLHRCVEVARPKRPTWWQSLYELSRGPGFNRPRSPSRSIGESTLKRATTS